MVTAFIYQSRKEGIMGSSKELRDSSNGTVPPESKASSGKQSDALSVDETITVDPPEV